MTVRSIRASLYTTALLVRCNEEKEHEEEIPHSHLLPHGVATQRSTVLEKQSARLRGLARLSNMTIVGEVFECGNGIARQRPGWNKALEIAAEKGANAIFVTDYSRIAHDWDTHDRRYA